MTDPIYYILLDMVERVVGRMCGGFQILIGGLDLHIGIQVRAGLKP